jgi:hypothetical protein
MSTEHRIEVGQQLALHLAAGTEVFCASGIVQLSVPGALDVPVSMELGPGRGWRAATGVRIVVNARSQARIQLQSPPKPDRTNCPKRLKWSIWSVFPPRAPSKSLEKC